MFCIVLTTITSVPVVAANTGTVFSVNDPAITAALSLLNNYRKQAGLKPVTLSAELSKACYQHSRYVVKNRSHPSTFGLSGHYEVDSLPYATPGGKKAGLSSCIAYVEPGEAVAQFMNTFYHRMPLIDPNTIKVGIGYYTEGYSTVCCVDMRNDWQWDNDTGTHVVIYPPDNTFDVPNSFQNERPNPIPDSIYTAGYPVTIQFFRAGGLLKNARVQLTDNRGNKLNCLVSTPDTPLTDFPQYNTVCIIPVKPLNYNTTYTVDFTCQVGGTEFKKKWSFYTTLHLGG